MSPHQCFLLRPLAHPSRRRRASRRAQPPGGTARAVTVVLTLGTSMNHAITNATTARIRPHIGSKTQVPQTFLCQGNGALRLRQQRKTLTPTSTEKNRRRIHSHTRARRNRMRSVNSRALSPGSFMHGVSLTGVRPTTGAQPRAAQRPVGCSVKLDRPRLSRRRFWLFMLARSPIHGKDRDAHGCSPREKTQAIQQQNTRELGIGVRQRGDPRKARNQQARPTQQWLR